MNQTARKIGQILTGAGAAATLWAGRVMASTDPNLTNPGSSSHPAQDGAEAARANGMPSELVGENGVFTQISSTILFIVGVISVIMLIWGGLRYIVSGGDNKKVTDAKNTIMYAIIGLIISILAYAIIEFVLNTIAPGTVNLPE